MLSPELVFTSSSFASLALQFGLFSSPVLIKDSSSSYGNRFLNEGIVEIDVFESLYTVKDLFSGRYIVVSMSFTSLEAQLPNKAKPKNK